MKRRLIIDGDTIAYKAASVCQHTVETHNGHISPFAMRWEGEVVIENILTNLKNRLKSDDVQILLSCPKHENFRYKLYPDYKSNRKELFRPYLLGPLKDYLRLTHGATHLAFLEADDAIGIFATLSDPEPVEKIIVGYDKDFKLIPGKHHQLGDDSPSGRPIIRSITASAAYRSHMEQTLSGDATDGYAGCPGIGSTRASRILEDPVELRKSTGVVTRGPRKGQKVDRWVKGGRTSLWKAVLSQYRKAGATAEEALLNARLAKILLAENYTFDPPSVILWVPKEYE